MSPAAAPRRDFLEGILERKRAEVGEREARVSASELEARCARAPAPRSLSAALSPSGGPTRIVAELKRASPSAGALADFDPARLAATYARGGAAALSILTDGPGFQGSLEDVDRARAAVQLPILRKDFVVDRYQLLEARAHGADAALLIAAALGDRLAELLRAATELGLEALVEVHSRDELDRALEAGARLVGVNNRDLRSFAVDLATSEALVPLVPGAVRAVAESGIRGPADVRRLRRAGAANFLVGEALVRSADPAALLRELEASR